MGAKFINCKMYMRIIIMFSEIPSSLRIHTLKIRRYEIFLNSNVNTLNSRSPWFKTPIWQQPKNIDFIYFFYFLKFLFVLFAVICVPINYIVYQVLILLENHKFYDTKEKKYYDVFVKYALLFDFDKFFE